MANPIRRMIQLVLDRRAARQVEEEAKRSLGSVDRGLSTLKRSAAALGAALLAAFGVAKLIQFGREAVRQASLSEAAWKNLAGTIDAVGGSSAELMGTLRATASAFQDASTHGDEDYANALRELITVTGDVSASINNMGLVANVAAQFFDGNLATAVDTVGRVMNGQTMILTRMGIKVKDAQEGLEVLAQRSFGAASREANTFGGQVATLTNYWGDFQEALGFALVGTEEAGGALSMLTDLLRNAIVWVDENRDALRGWIANGLELALNSVDIFGRGLVGMGLIITGGVRGALALLAGYLAAVTSAASLATRGVGGFLDLLGIDGAGGRVKNFSADVQALSDVLGNLALASINAGNDLIKQGVGVLGRRVFSGFDALPDRQRPDLPGGNNRPQLGTGAAGTAKAGAGEGDPIADATEAYEAALAQARTLKQLLGEEFDELAAEADATATFMKALVAAGVAATDERLVRLRDRGAELRKSAEAAATLEALDEERAAMFADHLRAVGSAVDAFNAEMRLAPTLASALGEEYDGLAVRADALRQVITRLAEEGMDASNPLLAGYIRQLQGVTEAIDSMNRNMLASERVAEAFGDIVAGALGGNIGQIAAAKAKQNAIMAAEEAAHGFVSLLNPFTAATAGGHFIAAAKFTAIAAAWTGLARVSGGGALSSASGGLAGSRGLSSGAARSTEGGAPEVHIYLNGHLSAMDPRVQATVLGALREGSQRRGAHSAGVTLHPARA